MDDIGFFLTEDFHPKGYGFLWKADVLWLHVASDAIIFVSYMIISAILFIHLHKAGNSPYRWIVTMFALFIAFCGLTHGMSVVTVWWPHYGLEGIFKAATAATSIATAILFIPLAPRAFKLLNGTKGTENEKQSRLF